MTKKAQITNNRLIYLLVICLLPLYVYANESLPTKISNNNGLPFLVANPERCVALHQGQTCYQNVIFKWQAVSIGDYCLFLEKSLTPVKCWKKTNSGNLKLDFQSKVSKTYYLRMKQNNINIASRELIVAWVYGNKKRRRASWRLF